MPSSRANNPHAQVRREHSRELAEDYVEAIADLIAEKGACRAVDLAKRFAVSHVSVIKTVQRLETEGLVETKPYAPIALTKAGETLAAQAKTRHQRVFDFLRALGVSEANATLDAEGIEHHCSAETLRCMQAFLESLSPTPKKKAKR